MKLKFLILSLFMLTLSTVAAAGINKVEILVYDASITEGCISEPELGCIRMQVTLNNGEDIYKWIANSGGEGYRLRPQLTYENGKTIGVSGYYPVWFEGKSTPSYENRTLGDMYGKNYVSYTYRYKLPFFTRILDSQGGNSGVGIFGNDLVNGSTSHNYSVSVSIKNMEQLSKWILEARSNGGNGYITVTVPRK